MKIIYRRWVWMFILIIACPPTRGEGGTSVPVTITPVTPEIFKISWHATAGQEYRIECAEGTNCWSTLSLRDSASDGTLRHSIVADQPQGFFRVTSSAAAPPVTSPNLVRNGGFEEMSGDQPVGWQKGGYGGNTRVFLYPVPGYASPRGARVAVSAYASGDAKWFFDDIPVLASNKYLFSCRYTSTVPANLTARYKLSNGAYSYPNLLLPPTATSWAKAETQFTVPAGATSMTVFHALTTNGTLVIDDVSVSALSGSSPLSQGMISFDFDDGWEIGCTNAAAVLGTRGYKGTFFIITSRVGRPTVLSVNQLKSLQAAGHEVTAHTVTHTNLTWITEPEIERELNLSKAALKGWGIGPCESFAYPFGANNALVRQLVQEAGYQSACITDPGLNDKASFDPYRLYRSSIHADTSFASIAVKIDEALAQKKWLILLFHHVGGPPNSYTVSPAFLKQIVDYIHLKNAKVVTAREGLALMKAP